MMIIRPIHKNDTDAFIEIAYHARIGMTSMPRNRHLLLERVAASEKAFAKELQTPNHEKYLFVMEDLSTQKIVGTSGITARERHLKPIHFYRLEERDQKYAPPGQTPKKNQIMRVVHYYDAPSELCSLYLLPQYRHSGNGRLLSLSRLMFIASFRERFDKMLFANMRGYIDANDYSPFWEGIGRHFAEMNLTELMHLHDEEAIDLEQILPDYPIYTSLLPKEVQESIGKTHPDTHPALNMLMQEGFILTEEVDVIDGGPIIEVEVSKARTVETSVTEKIIESSQTPLTGPNFLISNNKLDFRATLAKLGQVKDRGVILEKQVMDALNLKVGDTIRYCQPYGLKP
jgi:arginine N-succinyltransferase